MTWQSAIDLQAKQERVRGALVGVLVGLSDEVAEHRPLPQTLSIAELLAHLILVEQRVVSDMEMMLHQDYPDLPSIQPLDDPGRLRALVRQAGSLAVLLGTFDRALKTTRGAVEQLDEEQERRSGYSPDLGIVWLGTHAATNMLYHVPGHIEEMRMIRQQLGLGAGQPLGQPT